MKETKETKDQKTRKEILDRLEELGGLTVQDDTLVFEGDRFILPAQMEGNVAQAAKFLTEFERSQEQKYEFSRTFNYRPWDGANAFAQAMKRVFGTTGIGKATAGGLFGDQEIPPEFVTIEVGPNETVQVPWGAIRFSPLDATFELGGAANAELGAVFKLYVTAPKKYRKHIDAFFQVVQDELERRSIYKGKAITGGAMPTFLDTTTVDANRVVYSEDVMTQLDANVWSLLNHTETVRNLGIPLKRAVLVEGPYGTGKTLCGALTAQTAVANGWTFILARPGTDDLFDVLRTAQIYAPAVVWYEDIDTVAESGDPLLISRLLDALDGITTKNTDVVAGFTTNHVNRIPKGVLRPGRLDAVIHIGSLDNRGIEKLIKVTVPERLLGEVDYPLVCKAFNGMLPAFCVEAIGRALRYVLARNGGVPDVITTDDLVNAADGLRPQLDLMNDANEGTKDNSFERALKDVVRQGVEAYVEEF